MTAWTVVETFNASRLQKQEDMSVLAYRTAVFTRMKNQHLPTNEAALLKKAKPKADLKPQTIKDQRAMAKFITNVMGGTRH